MKFSQRLFPNQEEGRRYFASGDPETFSQELYDFIVATAGIVDPVKRFELELSETHSHVQMSTSPLQSHIMKFLVSLARPKNILEIGTFIGITTLELASATPAETRIVTIEKYPEFAKVAAANFKHNRVGDKISLLIGDALEVLPTLKTKLFDFIYLDGNKERYWDYFVLLEPMMAPGAVVAVDDVFFNGDVLNKECKTEKGAGVKRFMENVKNREGYTKTIFPMGNGLLILSKLE